MLRFKLILFFCCTIFTACKTKYATKEFKVSQIPLSPNYNSLESWAAHPEKNDSIIDVFYTTEKERISAQKILDEVNNKLDGKVVTSIRKEKNYCKAEEYHQKYFEKKNK